MADQANTTYPTSFAQPNITNPTVNQANNRFAAGQGWTYDAAGNTTADANGQTFVYDAENKQIQVNGPSGVVGQYFYDGDGKRVKKVVPSTNETTVFVYDAVGQLVAEYSTVFALTPGVNYLTADHLGSPRINTDQSGTVTARHDYMPFGEEIFSYGGRTSGLGYATDSVRKQFTGYERDNESELDFAQARMYSSKLGRFTAPDPYLPSAETVIPQTWNRYGYAGNNPLRYTDPDGLDYSDLRGRQKELIDANVAEYNKKHNTNYSAEDFYNGTVKDADGKAIAGVGFNATQRSTYEGVTNALMNIALHDKDGKSLGNALDLVEKVDIVAGKIKDKDGDEQFRVYSTLTKDAYSTLQKSVEFEERTNPAGYHEGYKISFQQKGGAPSVQISVRKDFANSDRGADIDVDYKNKGFVGIFNGHLRSSNSDVTSGDNYEKHIKRYPNIPLRNWWKKEKK